MIQSGDHAKDDNNACCNHFFRSTFCRDTIFAQHWYRWSGPEKDIPLELIDHHQLLHSRAEYIESMINSVRVFGTFIEANCQMLWSQRTPITTVLENVHNKIVVIHWLKNNDHVSERIWQRLLSYLYTLYYSLQYYEFNLRRIPNLDTMDPLYVPSKAVRHNDPEVNPLLLRRFKPLKSLTKTSAMKVYVNSKIRTIPFVSIIKRLFCPSSARQAIGTNIMCYLRGVYIVKDVHAIGIHPYTVVDLHQSIRIIYIQYHSNINYVVDIEVYVGGNRPV